MMLLACSTVILHSLETRLAKVLDGAAGNFRQSFSAARRLCDFSGTSQTLGNVNSHRQYPR